MDFLLFLKLSILLVSVINLSAVCSSESFFYVQVYLHLALITAIYTNIPFFFFLTLVQNFSHLGEVIFLPS